MKKTKFGVLGVGTENVVNIGDYIQALASRQYLPNMDKIIQREQLKFYNEEEIHMIMNGWYMHNPSQWPPSPLINPLFVAFHMNILARNEMLSKEGIDYLKKYEPIGCRDLDTRNVLIKNGIKAFFSGCMTLTLGKSYSNNQNDGKVYFVDPAFSFSLRRKKDVLSALKCIICHPISIMRLCKKNKNNVGYIGRGKVFLPIYMAHFFTEYSKYFDKEVLNKAEYICHQSKKIKQDFPTELDRINYAEELVKKYAKADFIVTSRIHCALPALGLETPVIFTTYDNDIEASKCRFEGLTNLFTIANWNGHSLNLSLEINKKIKTRSDFPSNKTDWRSIANSLDTKCIEWVKNIQDKNIEV